MIQQSEVKEKFPKSYQKLQEFILKDIAGTEKLKGLIPVDKMQIMTDTLLGMTFSSSRGLRILYDFFDENNIYCMSIRSSKWSYSVQYTGLLHDDAMYEKRIQAEEAGFLFCFNLLEKM